MENLDKNWFASWFDTEYYHLLYKHRNHEEAKQFIANLIDFLQLPQGAKVFDLACGKGRHSLELHSHGLDVLGMDLSAESIKFASQYGQSDLKFQVQDMRESFGKNEFKAGFNLFTSFGYFDDYQQDLKSLTNAYNALESQGYFVQDYLNAFPIIQLLPQEDSRKELYIKYTNRESIALGLNSEEEYNSPIAESNRAEENNSSYFIEFKWRKWLDHKVIVKDIIVKDQDKEKHFQERVQVYKVEELVELHTQAGFEVQRVFGDYSLNEYDTLKSNRIILISKKK